MENSLYVALSGQLALEKRLETIADNVANSSTPGFRATQSRFEAVVSKQASGTSFVAPGADFISLQAGAVTRTGNPLDIAVIGNAWLGIQTPTGLAYTRDGRMSVSEDGQLRSVLGYPIVDVGGAPVEINPNGGPIQIANDGMISQDGQQLGAVGLFTISPDAQINRTANSAIVASNGIEPALDFNSVGIRQGYIEASNTNAVAEVSALIAVTRAFEALANSIGQNDDTLRNAIRTIGGGS